MDCDLVTVGELFGRSGYGIGLKKGSPWADKITLDILDLHESEYYDGWLYQLESDRSSSVSLF